MSIYLIDYENVNKHGLAGIESLQSSDHVVIFLGKSTGELPADVARQIFSAKASVMLKKMQKTGKNYLDFQLAAYLGFLMGGTSEKIFVIVSADSDFDKVLDFSAPSKPGVSIKRQAAIREPKPRDNPAPPLEQPDAAEFKHPVDLAEGWKKRIKAALKPEGLDAAEYTLIYNIFASAESQAKLQSKLDKNFQQKRGQIFKLIREIQSDYLTELSAPQQEQADGAALPAPQQEQGDAAALPVSPAERRDEAPPPAQEQRGGALKRSVDLADNWKKRIRSAVQSEQLRAGGYTPLYNIFTSAESQSKLQSKLSKHFQDQKGRRIFELVREIHSDYLAEPQKETSYKN